MKLDLLRQPHNYCSCITWTLPSTSMDYATTLNLQPKSKGEDKTWRLAAANTSKTDPSLSPRAAPSSQFPAVFGLLLRAPSWMWSRFRCWWEFHLVSSSLRLETACSGSSDKYYMLLLLLNENYILLLLWLKISVLRQSGVSRYLVRQSGFAFNKPGHCEQI